jgi:hypothetical protein
MEQRFEQQRNEMMAPAQPHEYQISYPPAVVRDDAFIAFDSEVRNAFSAAGIPKHLGEPIFEAADRLSYELADAPQEIRQQRIEQTSAKLREMWGDQFRARLDAVDQIIAEAASHSETLGEIIDESPWLLADPAIWEFCDRVAQHRASKKRA